MELESNNKVAVITGAKQGIGLGICKALAKEGYNIVISDHKEEGLDKAKQQVETEGAKAITVVCDVTQKKEVDNMISKTIEKFGRLDLLVNNAGIFPFKSFTEMTEIDWDKVQEVNMKGVFLCSQAAVKEMKEGAKIVNISSIASVIGFNGLVHYCASKSGVDGFTRGLALELASKKINVNGVAPGAIETPGVAENMTDEAKESTIAGIPLKRMGQPDDIAHAVVFLGSDKANYITGQTMIVDGGWTIK